MVKSKDENEIQPTTTTLKQKPKPKPKGKSKSRKRRNKRKLLRPAGEDGVKGASKVVSNKKAMSKLVSRRRKHPSRSRSRGNDSSMSSSLNEFTFSLPRHGRRTDYRRRGLRSRGTDSGDSSLEESVSYCKCRKNHSTRDRASLSSNSAITVESNSENDY